MRNNRKRITIKAISRRLPRSFRSLYTSLRFCLKWFRTLRVEFWVLEGQEPGSRSPLSILCAAGEKDRNYLSGLAFGEEYRERFLCRTWLWNAKKLSGNNDGGYPMTFIRAHKSQRWLLGSGGGFSIPEWMIGEVALPVSSQSMNAEKVKSEKRRIRINGLEYEVTRDSRKFDDFYHNMYLPHILRVHGRSAFVTSYELMRKRLEHSDLLLVMKQGEPISGCMISYFEAVPRMKSLGVRDGDPEYLKFGATAALYYFSLLYMEGKGLPRFGLGGSRAFLHDGVLRYKRKWAQKLVDSSPDIFEFRILADSNATRSFLRSNPFIFEKRGSLYAAVFVDTERPLDPEELGRIEKEYLYPGLSKLYVCFFEGEKAAAPSDLPKELSERTVFLTTAQWFGARNRQRKN